MPLNESMTPEETAQLEGMRTADTGAPQAPAAPETPQAPAAGDDGDKPDAQGMVPHGRYHEEREKRKTIQKERDDLKANQSKLEGRFEMLQNLIRQEQQRQNVPQPATPVQIPDVAADPVGHFKAQNEVLQRQVNEFNTWKQQQEQNASVTNNVQRIAQIAGSHEAEFKKTNPDYDEASNWLRNLEDVRLQTMGYADPAARNQIINNRALEVALSALNSGKNAAEVVFAMAKGMGWTPKAKPANQQPNGQLTDQQKVEMAARGQQQGGGIGTVNGASPAPMTLTALANLTDDEFAKATSGPNWKKLMEGLSRG